MKKSILFLLTIALFMGACTKDDENNDPVDTGKPGEITITVEKSENTVTYNATATNAVKFIWDLGNGQTPEGEEVVGTYSFPGDYTIKCTAKGRDADVVKEEMVNVEEGDPNIFNFINLAVSGYDEASGESTAKWQWANNAGSFSCGPHVWGDVNSEYPYFNPIDDSWWACGEEENNESALDDEYFFNLNAQMEYVNDFKAEFMVNWAWMAANYNIMVPVWSDHAYEGYTAPPASWEIKHYENINDSLSFNTQVNGQDYPGAYVLHLSNSADLGIEAASSDYQIVKLENDTMWIRYDNAIPENLFDIYTLEDENLQWISGDAEWGYFKLVNANAKK